MSGSMSGRFLKGLLALLFLAMLAGGIARAIFFLPAQAEGNEMAPTIFRGEWVVAWLRASPSRGDVVLYEDPHTKKRLRIGRVIGLPGEKVAFHNQIVSVSGREISRSQGQPLAFDEEIAPGTRTLLLHTEKSPEGRTWRILLDVRRRTKDLTIDAGDGFVLLGDNRNHAVDSRELGPIPRARIKGVVRSRINPKEVRGIAPRGREVE